MRLEPQAQTCGRKPDLKKGEEDYLLGALQDIQEPCCPRLCETLEEKRRHDDTLEADELR